VEERISELIQDEMTNPVFFSSSKDIISLFKVSDYDSVLIVLSGIEQLELYKESEFYPLLQLFKIHSLYELELFEQGALALDEVIRIESRFDSPLTSYIDLLKLNLGQSLIEKNEYDLGIQVYRHWINSESQKDLQVQARVYHNLAVGYLHKKQFDSSLWFFDEVIDLRRSLGDSSGLVQEYMNLASLYYEQYLDGQAIPLFQKALAMAKQLGDTTVLKTAEYNMAVVEENRKNYAEALAHRKEYERLLAAEWNRDRIWALAEQQKQFAIDTKQQEVDLLAAREQQQLSELARQRTQRNGLLATAALLLALLGMIAYYYRRVRANNRVISAQKEQLNALNVAKNQLFAMVAHDLKSPVMALQRAQRKLSLALSQTDQAQAQSLAAENEHITSNTFRLLNNVLHWAMEQTEQLSFVATPMPVQQLLAQVVYDYQELVRAKGLTLVQDFEVAAQVEVDANLMKIVLRNLLDNALKFTQTGGTITLQATETGDTVMLTIADTGVGMTAEQQAGLFSLTEHEVRPDTEGRKSTGLGMLLCQRLVARHHGNITVNSEVGKGTQISIQLPIFLDVEVL